MCDISNVLTRFLDPGASRTETTTSRDLATSRCRAHDNFFACAQLEKHRLLYELRRTFSFSSNEGWKGEKNYRRRPHKGSSRVASTCAPLDLSAVFLKSGHKPHLWAYEEFARECGVAS